MQKRTKLVFLTSKGSLSSFDNAHRADVSGSLFSFASPYPSDSENRFFFMFLLIFCVFFARMFIQIQGSVLNKICFVLNC